MKSITIITAALLATGCASIKYVNADGQEAPREVRLACEYEAEKATAGTRDAALAGWNAGKITRMCLELRGYQRTQVTK